MHPLLSASGLKFSTLGKFDGIDQGELNFYAKNVGTNNIKVTKILFSLGSCKVQFEYLRSRSDI